MRIIIVTAGMPSVCSWALILCNIRSFSTVGMRDHLFQSECASASSLASFFVKNFVRQLGASTIASILDLRKIAPTASGCGLRLTGLLARTRLSECSCFLSKLHLTTTIKEGLPGSEITGCNSGRSVRTLWLNPPLSCSLGKSFCFFSGRGEGG